METETCTSTCQLCGRDYPHNHSPEEIVIYGNGRKHGIAAAQQQAAQARVRIGSVWVGEGGWTEPIADFRKLAENTSYAIYAVPTTAGNGGEK